MVLKKDVSKEEFMNLLEQLVDVSRNLLKAVETNGEYLSKMTGIPCPDSLSQEEVTDARLRFLQNNETFFQEPDGTFYGKLIECGSAKAGG